MKLKSGGNKDAGRSGVVAKRPVPNCGNAMFQRARGRRSCGDNTATLPSCCIDLLRTFFTYLVAFAMQPDLCRVCDADRLKRAESDMQRYRTNLYACRSNLGEDFRCKVQTCGRRRSGAPPFCVNRLISFTI